MDQPPQHPPAINTEGILAWALGVIATLGAIVVRGRFRIKGMREKVEAESAPKIETEYLEANEKITALWEKEIDKIRGEMEHTRAETKADLDRERGKANEWMQRAMACESRVPYLEGQIETLRLEVAELRKQVAEARDHRGDVR